MRTRWFAPSPDIFLAVGFWYADFSQLTDAEVETVLASVQLSASGHR